MLAAYVGGVRYRCKGRSRSLRDALEHFSGEVDIGSPSENATTQ
jgi:hypothetical protein